MYLFGSWRASIAIGKGLEPTVYPEAAFSMTVQQTRVYGSTTSAGGAFTITLPSVAGARGQAYIIYMVARNSTDDITLEDNSNDAGFSNITLNAADEYSLVLSDGRKWFEIASNHS